MTILWLGPRVDLRIAEELVVQKGIHFDKLFCVDTTDRDGAGLWLERFSRTTVLLPYTSLDSERDPSFYELAHRIGRRVLTLFMNALRLERPPLFATLAPYETAVAIHVGDRIYSTIRPFLHLRRFAERGEKVIVVERGSRETDRVVRCLRESGHPAEAAEDAPQEPPINDASGKHVRIPAVQLCDFDFPERRPTILFASRLNDDMFVSAVIPVIKKLMETANIYVYDQHIHLAPPKWVSQHDFDLNDQRFVWSARFRETATRSVIKTHSPLNGAVTTTWLELEALKGEASEDESFSGAIAVILDRFRDVFLAAVQYSLDLVHSIERVAYRVDASVVCPGRLLESMIFTQCIKNKNRPTFDLQSGTISPTAKFVAPLANTLLAIDRYSEKVYRDHLGVDGSRIRVIGSPRLDWHLEAVKTKSVEQARTELAVPIDARVHLFAGQPVSTVLVEKIMGILAEGLAAEEGAILYIRPHPRDSGAQLALYRALVDGSSKFEVRFASGGKVYDWLQCADVVLTYCSTIGLEAHALGKPVVAINPLETKSPFDLAELGVAWEVRSAEELGRKMALLHRSGTFRRQTYLTDGRAVRRAVGEIEAALNLTRGPARPRTSRPPIVPAP